MQTASRMRIDSDAEAYHVRIELDAREEDELRFTRRWEPRIPRIMQ